MRQRQLRTRRMPQRSYKVKHTHACCYAIMFSGEFRAVRGGFDPKNHRFLAATRSKSTYIESSMRLRMKNIKLTRFHAPFSRVP